MPMPRDPFDTPLGALRALQREPLAMRLDDVPELVDQIRSAAALGLFSDGPARGRRAPLAVQDGVAIIPIRGTILPHGTALSTFLGFASVEGIRELFRSAQARPDVQAILFEVDSPGGRVDGLADLADEIHAARGGKPLVALAADSAYSAAYFLASAADEVHVTQSGGVGSIGTIALHIDESQALEQEGLKITAITSGTKKAVLAPFAPLSEDGRAEWEAAVQVRAGALV
jgi:ClpP class serine protease